MDANSFPERIKTLITLHGTVSALAKSAGISESVVRKWRDGVSEPSRDHLLALIRATGVNIAWLVAGEGPMRPGEDGHEKLDGRPETLAPQGVAVDSQMNRAPSFATGESRRQYGEAPRETPKPAEIGTNRPRIAALAEILAQLPDQDHARLLDEFFARAQDAQQLTDLRSAVAELRAVVGK